MTVFLYPETIFTGFLGPKDEPRNVPQQEAIGRHLSWAAETKSAPKPEMLKAVPYFPKSVEYLSADSIRMPWVQQILRECPRAALFYLIRNYDAGAPLLERVIMGSGDYVCELLLWAKATGNPLMRPLTEYHEVLALDPWWAKYYADQTGDAAVLELAVVRCEEKAMEKSGAAWFMAVDAADPQPYKEVIARDPLYALLASQQLRSRGITFCTRDIPHLTASWAFHFLAFSSLQDPEEALKVCQADPGWYCELLKAWDKEDSLDREIAPFLSQWQVTRHPWTRAAVDYTKAWLKSRDPAGTQ